MGFFGFRPVTFALALLAPLAAHARPAPLQVPPGSALRLSADELSYRSGKECARPGELAPPASCLELRGRVQVGLGALELRTGRLLVELDGRGQPRRLEALAGVSLRTAQATGTADRASLLPGGQALELRGKVQVKLAGLGLELEGEHIDLDLGSGALRVRSARARLQAPRPEAPRGGQHALR